MSRSHRSFAWSLVLALLCAFVAIAAPAPAAVLAADQVLYVNTATDPYPAPNGSCTYLADPDTDVCSLRTAILKANNAAAADKVTIQFQVPRGYPGYLSEFPVPGFRVETWTIKLTQPLDFITHDNVIIDGFSQAQYTGGNPNPFGPEMIVDGSLQSQTGGLTFQSSNNTVKGLGIINFQTTGGFVGVGIEFRSQGANLGTNNTVQGCYIGIDRLGTNPAPNTIGIWLRTDNNLVGGDSTTTDQYNIISGNINDGILIEGTGNKVQGNVIGLNSTGQSAVGNQGNGVTVRIANNNLIGAPTNAIDARYRNVISGNYQQGVQIFNGQSNQIYGNLIGVDITGGIAIANRGDGVLINSSGGQTKNNIVGNTNFFNRNTISGNGGVGVHIQGDNTSSNQVYNNLIGPAASGLAAPTGTYTQTGVVIDQGADLNQVGGSAAGQPNVISANKGDGVRVAGFVYAGPPPTVVQANDNKIVGNLIGLNRLGTGALPNLGNGILLNNYVNRTTVGGSTSADRNQIQYNQGNGIAIGSTSVMTTTVLKNTIRFNTGNGINVGGALNTRIDGIDTAGANQISNNGANGIVVTSSFTTTIQFNAITNNAQNGILLTDTRYSTVASNTSSTNVQNGLRVSNGRNTTVNANTLNTNSQNGVRIDTASLDTAITNSTIYSNTLKGVLVSDVGTQRVKIVDNSMTGNQAGGIDLTPETVGTPGSATNPNHDIDAPFNLHINQNGVLTGQVYVGNGTPAACNGCTIQIFTSNPQTLDGQGRDNLPVTAAVAADGKFTANVGSVPAQLAITATDQNGNTSEFAVFTAVFGLAIQPQQQAQSAYPGDVITYTHQLVNNGTVDFDNIQLSAVSSLGWPLQIKPPSPIELAAGTSAPITLTLTLPTGSAENVREGKVDKTTITASAVTPNPSLTTTAVATDTTTVLGKFILAVDPLTRNGFGSPKAPNVDYTHTLTNIGNRSGTVNVGAATTVGGVPAPEWTTSVTPTLVNLAPGQSAGITARVVVPQGTQAGTVAQTLVTLSGPDINSTPPLTDTTTVTVDPLATMAPDNEGTAGACEKISFSHTVTNGSNGTTTFRLVGTSSLGSAIKFFSDTPGIDLGPNDTFTLNNSDKPVFTFRVEITVDCRALRGDTDLVTIVLMDSQNNVIGGASARDSIFVTRSAVAVRQYIPIITQP
jgi:hypothetical protein